MKFPVLLRGEDGLVLEELSPGEALPAGTVLVGRLEGEGAPCSPTLALNAHLSSLGPEELLRLALAEKARLEEATWREYERDTRGPVAVVARDPDRLGRFLETYGGVLDLRPYCLGRSPSFPRVEDLSLAPGREGVRLSALVWAPVHRDRCHGCGACGRVCRPRAILPGPRLDPARCDLCRACERACPAGALDLSRYEEVEDEFRFLLFLDLAPPEDAPGEHVFTPERLEELLGRLGRFRVVESVRFSPGLCQRVPGPGVGCRLCLDRCPEGALSAGEEGVAVDHLRCRDCGLCVSLCPTGALQEARFDDRVFFSYLRELDFLGGLRLVLGTAEDLGVLWWQTEGPFERTLFLAHPSPASLSPAALLLVLASGVPEVVFLERAPEGSEWVNGLLQRLFGRRPLVAAGRGEIVDLLRRPVPAPLPTLRLASFPGRRELLVALLAFFWREAGCPDLRLEGEGWGELALDEGRCTLCLACLNACRLGALAPEPASYALLHTAVRCVACGACVEFCPEGALSLSAGLSLEEEALEPRVLARDEPVACRRCGKVFGTRKSQRAVRERLRRTGRFAGVTPLLDLCEDCRVRALFEDSPAPEGT